MATDSKLGIHNQRLQGNTTHSLRSPGLFIKWPVLGLAMFLIGSLAFGALAYSVGRQGALMQWDLSTTRAIHGYLAQIPESLIEYLIFGFFVGKELVVSIGIILAIYFLYKHFWRELAMLVIGLGGGGLLWAFLSQYFARPRPETQIEALVLRDPSFPSGLALAAILCYGFLAYLLVPRMPSRFWKWAIVIVLALFIAFAGLSPLLLGAHYVTDVLAGYALAIAWAGLVYTLIERIFPQESARGRESLSQQEAAQGLRVPELFAKYPLLGLSLIIIGGLVFAGLGYNLLTKGPLLQVDLSVHKTFLAAAKAAPPGVNEIMLFGFYIGKEVVQVIVMVLSVYFIYKRFWRELAMLLISSAAGSVVWNFIIAYFARPRPPEQTGLPITGIPSFPSGHAMSALICYGFLAYVLIPKMPSLFWKWAVGITALALVLFDGFSRVFQGNHYLTDVLAGYALGLAWAGLVYTILERIHSRRKV